MKYSSYEVKSMSWHEWNKTMAKELNTAGFRAKGFNSKLGKWQDNYCLYEATTDPSDFILGEVDGTKEINYLKSIGLLNNGRCPFCGKQITGSPARFTSGKDHNMHFQICKSCCDIGMSTSFQTPNNTGCLLAIVMLPIQLIKIGFAL